MELNYESYALPKREIKISVVGYKGVGKSCYINRFTTGEFFPTQKRNNVININTDHGCMIVILIDEYDPECDGIIFMTSITDPDSWDIEYNKTKPFVICANKSDLREMFYMGGNHRKERKI